VPSSCQLTIEDCPAVKVVDATGEVTKTLARAEVDRPRRTTRDDKNMAGFVSFRGLGCAKRVGQANVRIVEDEEPICNYH